jgi:hypothetical protein
MNGRGLESYGGALRNTDKILFGTVKISVPEKMYAIGPKGRLTAKSVLTKNGTLTKSAIILESDKNSNKVEIIDQGKKHNDKILFGTIRIRLPQKMTVKGPNGKITTKNTLTNSNTISFANKDPSVKFIPGTNSNVQILDFGTNLKSQESQNKTPKTTKPKSTKSNKEKNDNKKFNAEPEFNKEELKKKDMIIYLKKYWDKVMDFGDLDWYTMTDNELEDCIKVVEDKYSDMRNWLEDNNLYEKDMSFDDVIDKYNKKNEDDESKDDNSEDEDKSEDEDEDEETDNETDNEYVDYDPDSEDDYSDYSFVLFIMDKETNKFDIVPLEDKSAESIENAMHKRYHIDDPILKDFNWKELNNNKSKSKKLHEDPELEEQRDDMIKFIKKYYEESPNVDEVDFSLIPFKELERMIETIEEKNELIEKAEEYHKTDPIMKNFNWHQHSIHTLKKILSNFDYKFPAKADVEVESEILHKPKKKSKKPLLLEYKPSTKSNSLKNLSLDELEKLDLKNLNKNELIQILKYIRVDENVDDETLSNMSKKIMELNIKRFINKYKKVR